MDKTIDAVAPAVDYAKQKYTVAHDTIVVRSLAQNCCGTVLDESILCAVYSAVFITKLHAHLLHELPVSSHRELHKSVGALCSCLPELAPLCC